MDIKRIVAGLLALALVTGGTALPMARDGGIRVISAAAEGSADYEYSELDDGTVSIVKYLGTEADIKIPDEIDGKKVTSIGEKAFYDMNSLTSVEIPEGVTEICNSAFDNCKLLREVILPGTLKTIGDSAFTWCLNMGSIYLPDGLESIGASAFSDCYSLNEVRMPEGVKTIGEQAFMNCYGLADITLPKGITEISEKMFFNCKSLKSIVIPDGVTAIGNHAFYYCISLSDVMIAGSVKDIGTFSFSKATSLGLKIYCEKGSAAAVYADDIGLDYVYMNDLIPEVTFEKGDESVELKWEESFGAEKYGVYGLQNGSWKKIAEVDTPYYLLEKLKPGVEYQVAVSAIICGKEYTDVEKAITVTPNEKAVPAYPVPEEVQYNEVYHQFRVKWSAVPDAQQYGIAVKLAGKWKVQAYTNAKTTTFTSPKLKPGDKYQMVICAKVNGEWDTSNISGRAFTITIK